MGRPQRTERIKFGIWGKILFSGICIGMPLASAYAAVHSYEIATALRDQGQLASATVTKSEPQVGKRRPYVVVKFTSTDGRQISATVDDLYGDRPAVGDVLDVRYAPGNPKAYIQDARQEPHFSDVWIWGGVAILSSALFTAMVVSTFRRPGRPIGA